MGRIADALKRAEQERQYSLRAPSTVVTPSSKTPLIDLVDVPEPIVEATPEQRVTLVDGLSESLIPLYEPSSLIS